MGITANSLISRALRLCQVKGVDQNPSAQEAADGLYALNSMLDAWSIERLMVYSIDRTQHTWPANTATRTIGSGGDFNTTRPIQIEHEGNFFRDGDVDYPVVTLPREKFDLVTYKASEGSPPSVLYFDGGFPTRTLFAYPIPTSSLTLFLSTWKPLQQFTALTTVISLPAGYQSAIEYNLCLWMAPEFGAAAVAAAERIEKRAALLKSAIKSLNMPNMVARVDLPGIGRRSRIESDT